VGFPLGCGIRDLGFVAALGVATIACGKKGPPLAPLVPIPAGVQAIDATRVGSDVFVTLTIPVANIDEYVPADLSRVDIYAYTGRTAPARARWFELATVVASVPVAPPPPKPGEEARTPPADGKGEKTEKPASVRLEPIQGSSVTIRDVLTPEELVQGLQAPVAKTGKADVHVTPPAKPGPEGGQPVAERPPRVVEEPLKRFYTALPINTRGRPGPPGTVAEFPLLPVPDPPPAVHAAYNERTTMITWEPSGGLIGFLLERGLAEEPLPFVVEEDEEMVEAPAAVSAASGSLAYNVYRDVEPDAPPGGTQPGGGMWQQQPPAPITAVPVPVLEFTDNVEFGVRRCYAVRAVRGTGTEVRVGDASPRACFTPIDVFPPAPPKSVATVASEGVISLIWEPNVELDLGGYIVLRGEAPGDTLHPLTAAAVADARFRDETVKPGVRYVYAVIAVDNRFPLPNVSAPSERVEETAR
jgi:hypothetical protein